MVQIENFELKTPRVVAMQLKARSEIRVVSGRLWLTLEGHAEDVWLQAGQTWMLPVNGKLWLSAEPFSEFRIAQATAAQQARRVPQTVNSGLNGLRGGLVGVS